MEFWVLIPVTATFVVLFAFMRNERVLRSLLCPLEKTTARVDLVQRYHQPDRPLRVTACDLLPNSKRVDCSQACIHNHA